MKTAPTKGQLLYSLNVGNAARGRAQVLTPVRVTKVGHKYFTVSQENWRDIQYHIDTWHQKSEFSADSELYESEQAYQDKRDHDVLWTKLQRIFDSGGNGNNLTLAQLRAINAIIETPSAAFVRVESETA